VDPSTIPTLSLPKPDKSPQERRCEKKTPKSEDSWRFIVTIYQWYNESLGYGKKKTELGFISFSDVLLVSTSIRQCFKDHLFMINMKIFEHLSFG